MLNRKKCDMCGEEKVPTKTGISVCPRCDWNGTIPWPRGYLDWNAGDPMPDPFPPFGAGGRAGV